MNTILTEKMGLLSRITELKRIYSVIENSFNNPRATCIAVTSGEQGEGKTTVTAGLASIAAQKNGKQVLAVDYNWHSPSLHKYFDIELTDSVDDFRKKKSVKELIKPSGLNNLDILPAAKTDSSLNSTDYDDSLNYKIIEKCKEAYDLIMIDMSAAFPVNQRMIDPISMSKITDGVILVALTNVTPRQQIKRTSIAIESAGGKILGAVANQWKNPII